MQRITRLPLLVLAILNRVPFDDPERDLVERTLKTVQEVWGGCVHVFVCMNILEEAKLCVHTVCA